MTPGDKKICIISANCQGAYLRLLLNISPEFSGQYDSYYFVNYKRESVPPELLHKCSLLIYQPLGAKWKELSSDNLLANVPSSCSAIAINYLTFPGYWPFFENDPRNQVSEDYPFGPFPYGDGFIISMLAESAQPQQIIEWYMNSDKILAFRTPAKVLEEYIAQQRDIEQRRDQKLLDFIISNYRKMKLFETYNHPSQILYEAQADDLLRMLGFRALPREKIPCLSYLLRNQQPIHPLLAEHMGIEFSCGIDNIYNIWQKPLSFLEYTQAYINWDVTRIGKGNYS